MTLTPTRAGRAGLRALFAGAAVLFPFTAAGQDDVFARVSLSVTQLYEGNLNAAPATSAEADLVSRFGPSVETGYRSGGLTLLARYAADAERYARHVELNRAAARQNAGLELRYQPVRRLDLNLGTSYVATHTPGEFNTDTLLAAARARAERITVGPAVAYEWSAVTRMELAATATRDTLEGGIATLTRSARLGVERRLARRSAYRLAYQADLVQFSTGLAEPLHLMTAGWLRPITRLTTLDVSAGPRFTTRGVRPELSARLLRQMQRGGISLTYGRTQATAVGERGTFSVQRAAAGASYRPARPLGLTMTAEIARSARDGFVVAVRSVLLEAVVQVRPDLSIVASGLIGAQIAALGNVRTDIPQRRLTLGLTAGLPPFGGVARTGRPS